MSELSTGKKADPSGFGPTNGCGCGLALIGAAVAMTILTCGPDIVKALCAWIERTP